MMASSTKNMHWQYNLYTSMNDPNLVVYRDNLIVIIKDKYPKSDLHFLVMPREEISQMRCLSPGHLKLLYHMEMITQNFIHNFPGNSFWWGFHANPTMVQLHMHLISDDFRGSGLKTAKHWNSFTTSFFVPLSKVIRDLQMFGQVQLMPPPMCADLLRAPLRCHKCGHRPVNMPSLKAHLLSHLLI